MKLDAVVFYVSPTAHKCAYLDVRRLYALTLTCGGCLMLRARDVHVTPCDVLVPSCRKSSTEGGASHPPLTLVRPPTKARVPRDIPVVTLTHVVPALQMLGV